MKSYSGTQVIDKLPKHKGGYCHLKIDAEIVDQSGWKRTTRLVCTIEDQLTFRCGLNHYGDGNYYIIVAQKNLKKLEKDKGDTVDFLLEVDPDQLGVDVPEILTVLLDQDPDLKATYDKLKDSRKRTLIHSFNRIKDIDAQVKKIIDFLGKEHEKLR